MRHQFTLSEMAEILSRVDEPTAVSDRTSVLRQLQNFTNKGLLVPIGTRRGDHRNTNAFSAKSLFLARILLILAKSGRDIATMRTVVGSAAAHSNENSISEGDLLEALRSIKAKPGRKWTLVLRNQSSLLPAFDGLRARIALAAGHDNSDSKVAVTLSVEIIELNSIFLNLLDFVDV